MSEARSPKSEPGFNVAAEFLRIAMENPEAVAIIQEDLTISYDLLAKTVMSFATMMQRYGVNRASVVAINTHDTFVSLATLLATSLLGAQWVEANKQLAQSKVVRPSHFFNSPEARGTNKVKFTEITPQWGPYYRDAAELRVENFEFPTEDQSPWMIVKTSGTTGYPKYLSLDQETIFKRSKAVGDDFKPFETRFTCLFPCAAYPFLTRALGALLNLATIVDSRDFRFWRKTGVNLVMGSPVQVSEILGGVTFTPKMPQIHVAGSKLSDPIAADLLRNFERVVDVYASTETNRSFKNVKRLDAEGEITTIGEATDAIVEIADEQGQICPPNKAGTVRVRNHYLDKDYLNDTEAAARSFRDGWFYPGDYGYWDDNGALIILSRQDDIANVGGIKVKLKLVDALLMSIDGVHLAASFKNPVEGARDQLIAFVEIEPGSNALDVIARAKESCLLKLGTSSTPARIVPVSRIPVNSDGEPQRRLCELMVLEKKGLIPANIPGLDNPKAD